MTSLLCCNCETRVVLARCSADYSAEAAFWQSANASLGEYMNWEMGIAGLLPPTWFPQATALSMANGSVWQFDQVPTRIASVRTMLHTSHPTSVAIYVHCEGGCDRTGELVGR